MSRRLNKIPPMVSSGSDERGEDEEPVVDGAVVIEKHRIDPQGGERARSIYACGPLRATIEEARFDALLFSPVATDQDLAVALKATIALSASMHNQAAPGQFTGLDSTAEAVAAALLQRFQIKPRGAKASRFDVDVAKLPADECEVRFYRANEKPWGPLSNLFRREVIFQGQPFATAEHAYQFGKPRKPEVRDWLMAAPSPGLLAMAAHGLYSWDITPGWSARKVDRMRGVLAAKFDDPELRELLLSTGQARIIEATTVDNEVNRFWGEVNGQGKNTLGILLMELRARLAAAYRKRVAEQRRPK